MTQIGTGAGESNITGEGPQFKRVVVLAGGTGQSARYEGHPGRRPHDKREGSEGNGVTP